jgi:hypothetical protein
MLQIKTTDTEWKEVPDPPKPKTMKIKITTAKTLHNKPVKPESIHETDENTARNLIKKGFAVAHDEEAKAVNLEDPSRLSEEQADAQAETLHDKKMAEKEAAETAAKSKKKSKR